MDNLFQNNINVNTQNSENVNIACLMSESATQSQQDGSFQIFNRVNNNLDVIDEEPSAFKILVEESHNEESYNRGNSNIQMNYHHTMNNDYNEKFKILSQEIDDVIGEVKKESSTNISNVSVMNRKRGNNQLNSPININKNTKAGQMGNNSLNNSMNSNFNLNLKTNQINQTKIINAPTTNNYSSYQNSYTSTKTIINPNLSFNNNPSNKTKPKLNNTYSSYPTNNELVITYANSTDELIHSTLQMMDDMKDNFCHFIDIHREKFLNNAETIKQILISETEFIISEEDKNRLIDERMELLFREMMNILNEFQRFNH